MRIPAIPLAAILVSDPTHGSVALNSDGSFTYTPMTGYTGSDSFTYRAIDGKTSSNVATVSITVGQPNHPPIVTNPGAQAGSEGQIVSLQISADDLDLDPLDHAAVGLPDGLSIDPSTGLIAGTISYHAAANSPYNVTVTVSDGMGGSTPVRSSPGRWVRPGPGCAE